MTVTQMSFAGAVMILAVAAIRAVAVNRLPKRTFVILWELVLLRLLIPFSVPSVTSVYTLFADSRETAVQPAPTAEYYISDTFIPGGAVYSPQENADVKQFSIWTVIWLSGIALCAVGFAVSYLLAFRRFRYAETLSSGYAVEWLKGQGIRRKVQIRLSGKISSPLTYGIFRPVILLPSGTDTENHKQLEYILAHELTHIKRFDILRKLVAAAAVCVHWFNPAVWVMYLLFSRDIELACDEAVVRKSETDCRSEYAGTLIDMEEKRAKAPSLSAYFSKNAVEERVVAIMKTRKIKILTAALACAVVAVVAGVFATSAYIGSRPTETKVVSGLYKAETPLKDSLIDGGITLDAENNKFVIYLDMLSSYCAVGSYRTEGGILTADTDDGKYTYLFRIIDSTAIEFIAEGSSPTNGPLIIGGDLADGTVFRTAAQKTALSYQEYTGYYIATTKEPFLFIESGSGLLDGSVVVKLLPDSPEVSSDDLFGGLVTGDSVRITTNRTEELNPRTAFVHSAEKLDVGNNIDNTKITPVLELGYTVETAVIENGDIVGLGYILPPQEPEAVYYTSTVEAVLPADIQPAYSEASTVKAPDDVDGGVFSAENSSFEVVYILSDEQKQRLREKYDISKMRARVNGAYTREYLDFTDELVSLGVFTREQTERFFLVSVPAHTGVLSGPLGETDINEASNIVEELENVIEKQKALIAYISEKSEDPERSQPEDFEYLEKAGNIAIKLMFRDVLYDLMR